MKMVQNMCQICSTKIIDILGVKINKVVQFPENAKKSIFTKKNEVMNMLLLLDTLKGFLF